MDLTADLDLLRLEFPILRRCVYLISNSLGAVPRQTKDNLERFYRIWEEEGVTAWQSEWWGLAERLGNRIAAFLNGKYGSVTMIPHATQAHWIALSTRFLNRDKKRNRIVMTDLDFPSTLYAVEKVSEFMGWQVDRVGSHGRVRIDVEEILERIDERTLFVATSHVTFKSAAVQDIQTIASRAHEYGALTLIDGYHGPGTIPVDLE
ncbi:MAG: aminotransferase class V-fold PLP-dependent enzyme, partial [Candidatus Aminicenantes bacterium]|nr:aminotransferase class V-fold PLP-dependent enzyme [Candidatus Aminicenantes bacterium]